MHKLAELDHRYLWHPFTQMKDWLKQEPIVIVSGKGSLLRDAKGKEYIDANASIWTNLHGHRHPVINAAIKRQLGKIAHSSALGLANEPAALLGRELVSAANPRMSRPGLKNRARLERVFYSDNGSTALEVALKLAFQFSKRTRKDANPRFLSLKGAYHGDTIGAVSLGHIDLFHQSYSRLLFETDSVMAPYCYRCPYNKAAPERGDAREYRVCRNECLDKVESCLHKHRKKPFAGVVFEPLMQGAAGMVPQPAGWLGKVAEMARAHGALLIADEVMTGFGRCGMGPVQNSKAPANPPLFACHIEGVQPDFLCLAKGLTGGYLPMAATLATPEIFNAFLGDYEEVKTFFHGHSYTGNQVGASAGLASLAVLQGERCRQARWRMEQQFKEELAALWELPAVGDIRQVGLVAGVELVRDWKRRTPFDWKERMGIKVCEAMIRRGVITRPVGNVIVLMPPYCTTRAQMHRIISTLGEAISEVAGGPCSA